MRPRGVLFLPGTDPAQWAKRWGLEPDLVPCHGCGKPRELTIPWQVGELRGLQAEPCECGEKFAPYCLVRDWRKGDLFGLPTPQKKRPKKSRRKAKVLPFRVAEERKGR